MLQFTLLPSVLCVAAAAGFAASMRAGVSAAGGYSESLGITPPHGDRERLDWSNCYDACAAIWGLSVNDAATAASAASP